MSRSRALGLYATVAWAILIMAIPFIVPHVPRVLEAVLFDGGCLIAVAGAILLVVEARERRQQRL
jgi:hypothetical protein